MTITGTQKFGLVMGVIPGINIIASLIKFVYYGSQETESIGAARKKVTHTAEPVDRVARDYLQNIEEDITRLKWFALLQVVPLVGLIFANWEYESLDRINKVFNLNVGPNIPKVPEDTVPEVPKKKDSAHSIEQDNKKTPVMLPELTLETMLLETAKNCDLAVLVYSSSKDLKLKTDFEEASRNLHSVKFALLDIDLDANKGMICATKGIMLYKNGVETSIIATSSGRFNNSQAIIRKIKKDLKVS